ncbi:Lipopolysaccharide-induced tumor necrosis factor-alpha factor [Brachionus plicatilis]|uniref:Lipopolysaccharide-induced tumor necrosis factor-alpha factor n=1 Tax=Brachionus plicatilis TaxID=10195 RepID=A0A3M7SYN1_BRAPC|nr:Lipopolysaccharide-induced tumor necrosis factor-alpha factor [Brachionus plicatilis]
MNNTFVTYPQTRKYGRNPQPDTCPQCKASIITKTEYRSGLMNWIICGEICLFGLFLIVPLFGCQCIPFCIDGLKDVYHSCPNCNQQLGKANRFS